MSDEHAWMAEAGMLRILRRTLPAQRHEVAGALSALKLQLAVARRRAAPLTQPGPDAMRQVLAADTAGQLAAMEEQQLAAQRALVELRLWDGLAVQRRPLRMVLAQSVGWVRQAAAMRGHRLLDASDAPAQAGRPIGVSDHTAPMVQVPGAHYMVLALLYATLDRLATPVQLTPLLIAFEGGWRLSLAHDLRSDVEGLVHLPQLAADPNPVAAPAGQGARQIDVGMVRALAASLSSADGVWHTEVDDVAGTPALSALVWRAAP